NEHAGQYRVLHGTADELTLRRDVAVDVGEDVLVDVPAEPQELDVGVARPLVAAFGVPGSAAAVLVEVRTGAAALVPQPQHQREAAQQDRERGDGPGRRRRADPVCAPLSP